MKKKISLILSLILCSTSIAFVSSCGSDTDTNINTNENTETESSIVDTETDSSTNTETDTSKDTETETSTDSSTDTEADSSTDTVTDSSTEAETETSTDAGTDTSTDTETDLSTDTEIDSSTDTSTDIEVKTVADLAANYPTVANKTLNERFLTVALKESRFLSLDANFVHDAKWIINGDKQVDSIDFAFHYGEGDSQAYYVINLALSAPLSIDDVINNADSLANVSTTRNQKYYFDYTQSIQGTRDELMNAIFAANGMSEEYDSNTTTRLIKDEGAVLPEGFGEGRSFTVVQINGQSIQYFTITIKKSSDDAEYISKLSNSSNYTSSDIITIDLSGEEVEYTATSTASATNE